MRSTNGTFMAVDPTARLMSKVREENRGYPTTCWVWQGTTGGGNIGQPYGMFWLDGRTQLAHRAAYSLLVGPVPDGLELDHLCRIRLCVRPLHLEPVSSQVNVHRSDSPMGQNARKTLCRRGHPFTGMWRGRRTCRACSAIRTQEHRARKAAAA